jgi:hypothetical protein
MQVAKHGYTYLEPTLSPAEVKALRAKRAMSLLIQAIAFLAAWGTGLLFGLRMGGCAP